MLVHGSVMVGSEPDGVWAELVDWTAQHRWIPLTRMQVLSDKLVGTGVRIRAQHGLRFGSSFLGLTDELAITGWDPPYELEVSHIGPTFTGVGVFTLEPRGLRSWLMIRERINLPSGTGGAALMARPVLQGLLTRSLHRFSNVVSDRVPASSKPIDPARIRRAVARTPEKIVTEIRNRQARQARRLERV